MVSSQAPNEPFPSPFNSIRGERMKNKWLETRDNLQITITGKTDLLITFGHVKRDVQIWQNEGDPVLQQIYPKGLQSMGSAHTGAEKSVRRKGCPRKGSH